MTFDEALVQAGKTEDPFVEVIRTHKKVQMVVTLLAARALRDITFGDDPMRRLTAAISTAIAVGCSIGQVVKANSVEPS